MLTDHLGTPIALVNANGEQPDQVVWAARYGAWGQIEDEYNPDRIQQPIRFQGQQLDEETGLHYNRFRHYDPSVGRYVTQDPIGLNGGVNNSLYPVNPISRLDPLGLQVTAIGQIGGSAVLGGGVEGNLGGVLTLGKGGADLGVFSQGGLSAGYQIPGVSAQAGVIFGDVNRLRGVAKNINGCVGPVCMTVAKDDNGIAGIAVGPGTEVGGSITHAESGAWSMREALGRAFDKYLGGK